MKTLAVILEGARKNVGLSRQDVAEASGVDQALLSKYERGKRVPSKQDLGRLSSVYQYPQDELEALRVAEKVVSLLKGYPSPIDILKVAESRIEYLTNEPASVDIKLPSSIEKQLKNIDRLQVKWAKRKPLEGTQLEKMLEYYKVKYTFESNRIEGNTLTMQETHLVVNEGVTIGGKSMREHLEAINHSDAIDYLMDMVHDDTWLSKSVLLDLHRLVLKGIDQRHAGKYRGVPVRISGSEHLPPQPFLVAPLMDQLFVHYKQQKSQLHPVILAAEMHERMVSIHPFIDGNGRTARLLMNLILLQNGYTLANLKGDQPSRLKYYKALEAVQVNNDPVPFYQLIADEVERSLNEHLELV